MTATFHANSVDDTLALAESIGRRVPPGMLILLFGELGAGKTVFAKGLGKGLGVNETITSPSFNLMLRYQGRVRFDHWDLYRVASIDDDGEFIESVYDPESVKAIEWADKLRSKPDVSIISVELAITGSDGDERMISIGAAESLMAEVIHPAISERGEK